MTFEFSAKCVSFLKFPFHKFDTENMKKREEKKYIGIFSKKGNKKKKIMNFINKR